MPARLITNTASHQGRQIFIRPGETSMSKVSYGRIRLNAGQPSVAFANGGSETGLICLSGHATVDVNGASFALTTGDGLYVPKQSEVRIDTQAEVDLVECSAEVDGSYPVQYVPYAELKQNPALHFIAGNESTKREINIVLGSNIRAGRIVAGFTRSMPGNWTSWPPHEHAEMLEEIYVFYDMPAPAYGMQLVYTGDVTPDSVEIVRDGDAVLVPEGFHPNVAIPGASINFVWIMGAHREVEDRKWGVVNVDLRYA